MKLKEALKQEWAETSSFRKKVNYVLMPIYLAVTFLPLIPICVLMEINEEKYYPAFFIWLGLIAVYTIAILCSLPFITKKEVKIELERYGYMFRDPAPSDNESVKISDPFDGGLRYVLSKDGVTAEWDETPEEGGQVFDEMKENLHFVPWKEASFALATQTRFRRVHIALAVLFEETEDGMEGCAYFIPMTEELYKAIHAFGLRDRLGADWDYLFYNPEDAFKQVLKKGRIITMRNKKTGKIFRDKYGNFIGDEE